MAVYERTNRGIEYNTDGNDAADVLRDMQHLAETTDTAIDNAVQEATYDDTSVKTRLKTAEDKISNIEAEQNTQNTNIDANASAINVLEGIVQAQGQTLEQHTTEIDTTNQNVTNLMGRVSTNETNILNIKAEQTTQNTNIQANATEIAKKANQTSLDATNQNLTNLAERVSTNEEDIADIKEEQIIQNTNIEELQNQVETLQEDLESANSEIAELNTDITNMRKAMITVDGQGTDITLENTSENKFVEFGLEGRTEQESLSGKNLLDGANPTKNNSAIVSMTNNTIKVSSTAINTTPSVIYEIDNVQQGDTYRINAIIKNSNGQIVLQTKQDDTWTTYVILPYINGTSITSYSYVIGTNVEAIRYLLYADKSIPTGASESNYENVIVTKNNADMTYEPYCGGIPSPNPDFPQQIKNVTGNSNVKIQNKNLLNRETCIENAILTWANGTIFTGSDVKGSLASDFIQIKKGQEIVQTYKSQIMFYDIEKKYLGAYNNGELSKVGGNELNHFSVPNNNQIKYMRVCYRTVSNPNIDLLNANIQLEQGSTATDYVPHQEEQNYPFTFAQSQRGMQGTTLQDDGIHNARARVDLSTLTWTQYGTNKYQSSSLSNVIKKPTSSTIKANILAEKYIVVPQSASFTNGVIGIGTNGAILCMDETGTPSGILEYELSEEAQKTEIIPYNETQQAQYNNIKANASSYDDITIISSESDELGFDMNVVAVADANKVIDNQNSEIDTIKSRLDLLEG